MKQAHIFFNKEALSDLLFGPEMNIEIQDILELKDGKIFMTLSGDNLPNDCTLNTKQVRLTIMKDIYVDSDKKPHQSFRHTILMRDELATNYGTTTYAIDESKTNDSI